MTSGLLTSERTEFHRELIKANVISFTPASSEVRKKFDVSQIASNADMGQKSSIRIANALASKIGVKVGFQLQVVAKKIAGQTLGDIFEEQCKNYLIKTFLHLSHLRPGKWDILKVGTRNSAVLGKFEQYSHLADLEKLSNEHDALRTFLGEAYTIAPDVIITRNPEPDEVINGNVLLVDEESCQKAALRQSNHTDLKLILHASLSCKFTMRSDRSQNSRTEALNLLRTRKGRAPHIVAITAEPTPARIASLALGTGDMDCVYHFALYELREVLVEQNDESALDLLDVMIEGKRLKDISDLPLDLAV